MQFWLTASSWGSVWDPLVSVSWYQSSIFKWYVLRMGISTQTGDGQAEKTEEKKEETKAEEKNLVETIFWKTWRQGSFQKCAGRGGARITHTSCFCIEPLLEMSMVKEAGWRFFTAIAAKEILFIGEPKAISMRCHFRTCLRTEEEKKWGCCRLTTTLLRCFILERLALCGDCCCCSSMRIPCVGFYKWDYYPPAFLLQKSLLNRHRIQPMSQVTTSL